MKLNGRLTYKHWGAGDAIERIVMLTAQCHGVVLNHFEKKLCY
jgi:hypothetical protein